MVKSGVLFNVGIVFGFLSTAVVIVTLIELVRANDDLIVSVRALNNENLTVAAPSTNEQITLVRRKIRQASDRIARLKSLIATHATNAQRAQARQSLDEARRLIDDIAQNSQRVAEAHKELEAQFSDIVDLYNRRIQEVYESQVKASKPNYGLGFWAGMIGIIGSISAMILAWRKDRRDVTELQLEIEKLRQSQSTAV